MSLFTNVPLLETTDITLRSLIRQSWCHNSDISSPSLSEISLGKLVFMVTSGVESSFDDITHRQIDGVAMGSPLGPLLAKSIF